MIKNAIKKTCIILCSCVFIGCSQNKANSEIQLYYGTWVVSSYKTICSESDCFAVVKSPQEHIAQRHKVIISKELYSSEITGLGEWKIKNPIYVREPDENGKKVFYIYGKPLNIPAWNKLSSAELTTAINNQIKDKNYLTIISIGADGKVIDTDGTHEYYLEKELN